MGVGVQDEPGDQFREQELEPSVPLGHSLAGILYPRLHTETKGYLRLFEDSQLSATQLQGPWASGPIRGIHKGSESEVAVDNAWHIPWLRSRNILTAEQVVCHGGFMGPFKTLLSTLTLSTTQQERSQWS